MKTKQGKLNLKLEAVCCLITAGLTFSFYGAGLILSSQGKLGLIPLLMGAAGAGIGFWIWHKLDQIVNQKSLTSVKQLVVVCSLGFGFFLGMLARERLLVLGVNQAATFIIWGMVLLIAAGLGFRIRFLISQRMT